MARSSVVDKVTAATQASVAHPLSRESGSDWSCVAGFMSGPENKEVGDISGVRQLGQQRAYPDTSLSRQESWFTILADILKLSGTILSKADPFHLA